MDTTIESVGPATDIPAELDFPATVAEAAQPVLGAVTSPAAEPQSVLPLSRIFIKPGHNPRGFFDPKAHSELVESIREQGVLQSILVRPAGDGTYWVVAGECRHRAAMEAHGPDFLMPVLIRHMTDEEAAIFAMVENTNRQNMSPTEEAMGANKILIRCKGDRDEAARQLGWSRSTLDKRLALMACTAEVRLALDERRIKLGHAELLAALAKEKQNKFLEAIITRNLQVSDVKKKIEEAACKIQTAIFDKTECATCPHNSTFQKEMFSEAVTEGSCTNPTCYAAKEDAHLEGMKTKLTEEYPVVRIYKAGDNGTTVTLQADGPKGVGAEQFQACHACADFGVAISALPESKGKVSIGQCFNLGCNSKKIAIRINAETAAAKAADEAKKAPTTDATGKPIPAAAKPAAAEKVVTSVNEGDRIKAYREGVWRQAMAREIRSNPDMSPFYLIALCLAGHANKISDTKLQGFYKKLGGKGDSFYDLGEVAKNVIESDEKVQSHMLSLLSLSAMETLDINKLQQLAAFHEVDLRKHWKLCEEMLTLLTKAEIKVIAQEVGLVDALGAEFNKAANGSKGDFIKKLLGVPEFDYSATIPTVMKMKQ